MTIEQRSKNLIPPTGSVDVILDTDAYNEIDDQFAIAYLLRNQDRLNIKGFCAAPFFNENSTSPADGMERSYQELFKLLDLAGEQQLKDRVFRGSACYLPNENTPVESDSADFIATLARNYSPDQPLYIIAIGAITNVASALLKNEKMKENTVIIWLGGHGHHFPHTKEFNMMQDIAAARVVFNSGVPLVQLPCMGVVDRFATSRWELEYWLKGKNPLCDYLVAHTCEAAESYAAGSPWTRVIWDVTAVAWLLNDRERFMQEILVATPIPEYDHHYSTDPRRSLMKYVYNIHRDALFTDLFRKLGEHL